MTIKKPNRTEWQDTQEEKVRYLKREQEERETRRSLRDFLRQLKEEEDDRNSPTYPL